MDTTNKLPLDMVYHWEKAKANSVYMTQPIGGAGARIACGVIEGIDGAVNIRGKPVRTGAAETDAQ